MQVNKCIVIQLQGVLKGYKDIHDYIYPIVNSYVEVVYDSQGKYFDDLLIAHYKDKYSKTGRFVGYRYIDKC